MPTRVLPLLHPSLLSFLHLSQLLPLLLHPSLPPPLWLSLLHPSLSLSPSLPPPIWLSLLPLLSLSLHPLSHPCKQGLVWQPTMPEVICWQQYVLVSLRMCVCVCVCLCG